MFFPVIFPRFHGTPWLRRLQLRARDSPAPPDRRRALEASAIRNHWFSHSEWPISRDLMRFYGGLMGFHGILWWFNGILWWFNGISWDFMVV